MQQLFYVHAYILSIQSHMLDVSLIHQQRAHVQHHKHQESPVLPQRLHFFVWHIHPGHLCKRYPHVSFLMHPQGWPQQHSLQAFFFSNRKKYCHGWKGVSCVGEGRREGGYGEGGQHSGIMLHEITSAASSMKPDLILWLLLSYIPAYLYNMLCWFVCGERWLIV